MPDSNIELQLEKLNGEPVELKEPRSRVELYLAKLNGESVELPEPQSRVEKLLLEIINDKSLSDSELCFIKNWYDVYTDNTDKYGYYDDNGIYHPTVLFDFIIPEYITGSDSFISLKRCGNERTIIGNGVTKLTNAAYNMVNVDSKLESVCFPKLSFDGPALSRVFANNSALKTVTLKTINNSRVGTTIFEECVNLENLTILGDALTATLYLYWSNKLTQECLHHLIEKYAGYTGTTQLTFWIGEENIAKIDEAHIKILNDKNINYK